MIDTDGNPTIANNDPFINAALEAGGHLADDVARVWLTKAEIAELYPHDNDPED